MLQSRADFDYYFPKSEKVPSCFLDRDSKIIHSDKQHNADCYAFSYFLQEMTRGERSIFLKNEDPSSMMQRIIVGGVSIGELSNMETNISREQVRDEAMDLQHKDSAGALNLAKRCFSFETAKPIELFYNMGQKFSTLLNQGICLELFAMPDVNIHVYPKDVFHVFLTTGSNIYLINIITEIDVFNPTEMKDSHVSLTDNAHRSISPPIIELLRWTDKGWVVEKIVIINQQLKFQIENGLYKFARGIYTLQQAELSMLSGAGSDFIYKNITGITRCWGQYYTGYCKCDNRDKNLLMFLLSRIINAAMRLSLIEQLCHRQKYIKEDVTFHVARSLMHEEASKDPTVELSYKSVFDQVSHVGGVLGVSDFTKQSQRHQDFFVLMRQELNLFLTNVKVDKSKLLPKENVLIACLEPNLFGSPLRQLLDALIQNRKLPQSGLVIKDLYSPEDNDKSDRHFRHLLFSWLRERLPLDFVEQNIGIVSVYKLSFTARVSEALFNATSMGGIVNVERSVSIFHQQGQTIHLINCVYLNPVHKIESSEDIIDIVEVFIWHENDWKLQQLLIFNKELMRNFDHGPFRGMIMLQWILDYEQKICFPYFSKQRIQSLRDVFKSREQDISNIVSVACPLNPLEMLLHLLTITQGGGMSLLDWFKDEAKFYRKKRKVDLSVLKILKQDLLALEYLYHDSAIKYRKELDKVYRA